MLNRRAWFIGLALVTIAIGLVVHIRGAALNPAARDIVGDALWASMIVWIVSAVAPSATLPGRCAASYAVCVIVETSQLYHNAALDAVRATLAGHLILGNGFDPRDFAAYAAGVICAALIEVSVLRFAARGSR